MLRIITLVGCMLALVARAESDITMNAASALGRMEAVGYTTTEFLADAMAKTHTKFIRAEYALTYPYFGFLGALIDSGPQATSDIEQNYGAVLVGVENFVGPHNKDGSASLGSVSGDCAYIAVLKNSVARPDLEQDFRNARIMSIHGQQVWTWTSDPYEGHPEITTHFAAQINQDYFVLANNKDEFAAVVESLTHPATLKPLAHWSALSIHKYWMERNVRQAPDLPADVKSLTLWTDLADGTQGDIHFEVKSVNPPHLAGSNLKADASGIWKTQIHLSKNIGEDSVFAMISMLGFGVAV